MTKLLKTKMKLNWKQKKYENKKRTQNININYDSI